MFYADNVHFVLAVVLQCGRRSGGKRQKMGEKEWKSVKGEVGRDCSDR